MTLALLDSEANVEVAAFVNVAANFIILPGYDEWVLSHERPITDEEADALAARIAAEEDARLQLDDAAASTGIQF